MKRGDRQHEKPVLLPAQTKYANYIVAHTDDTDAQNIHTRHTKKHAKVPVCEFAISTPVPQVEGSLPSEERPRGFTTNHPRSPN